MKLWKIFALATTVVALTGSICCAKQKVAIVMDAPETFYSNPTVQQMVDERVKAIFPIADFEVVPMSDGIQATINYRNTIGLNAKVVDPRGGYANVLKKDDVAAIGQRMGCDLVLYSKLSNGATKYGNSMFATTAKTTVACDLKIYNMTKGMYSFVRQYMEQGKSTAIYAGLPSSEHSYYYAYDKILKAIKLNPAAL